MLRALSGKDIDKRIDIAWAMLWGREARDSGLVSASDGERPVSRLLGSTTKDSGKSGKIGQVCTKAALNSFRDGSRSSGRKTAGHHENGALRIETNAEAIRKGLECRRRFQNDMTIGSADARSCNGDERSILRPDGKRSRFQRNTEAIFVPLNAWI